MKKGITQSLIIVFAIIGSAFAEAALPIWFAHPAHGKDVYLTSSTLYGTLNGWHKCMADELREQPMQHPAKIHKSCNNKIAQYESGILRISDVNSTPSSQCPAPASANQRTIKARIRNTSENIYISNVSWVGVYPIAAESVSARGGGAIWITPGESQTVCLFTLKFRTRYDAAIFDAHPQMLAISTNTERGLKAAD